MSHAGQAIKKIRLKHGLSQGKLAKMVGHNTPQAVSNAERGIASFPAYWIGILKYKLMLTNKEALELLEAKVRDVRQDYLDQSGLLSKGYVK